MKQFIPLCFILFFCGACTTDKPELLSANEIVLNHFTVEEAIELESIHDFFMSYITDAQDKNSDEAIQDLIAFQENLKLESESGVITIPIPLDEEKVFFKTLSSSVFDKIWHFYEDSEEIGVSIFSVYVAFLDEVGMKQPMVGKYSENIKSSGTISAGNIALLLMRPEEFDRNDPIIRLLTAIHYITYNYNGRVTEEDYLD